MGQFSVENPVLPGSALSGNQQALFTVFAAGRKLDHFGRLAPKGVDEAGGR
jgi:hypothetical protein